MIIPVFDLDLCRDANRTIPNRNTFGVLMLLSTAGLAACGTPTAATEPVGQSALEALVIAPADGSAGCLQETVVNTANGRKVTQSFALAPGAQTMVTLTGVPAGDVEVTAQATAQQTGGACTGPVAWVAKPVRLYITPGQQAEIVQHLLSQGNVVVDPDFESIHDVPAWTQLTLAGGPTGTILQAAPVLNYDAATNRLVAFYASNPAASARGGQSSQVWIIQNANGRGGAPAWTQLAVSGTLPDNINANTTAVYTHQNQLLVYGGCEFNCSPAQSDVYELSNANGIGGPAIWTRLDIAAPRTRSGHQSAFDPSSNRMISFGGNQAFFGTDTNDTAVFDVATLSWIPLDVGAVVPGARSEAFSSAYDAATKRLMVCGGDHLLTSVPEDITQYNDLWVLENANGVGPSSWQQLNPSGTPPAARSGNSAVFDSANDRLVIFGGATWSNDTQSSTPLGDLWQVTNANGLGGPPEWSQLQPTGDVPGPTSNPAAALDVESERMMLVGPGDVTTGAPPKVWVLAL